MPWKPDDTSTGDNDAEAPIYMSEDSLVTPVEPIDLSLRQEYEALIRDDYCRCHPDDTLELLRQRARFSKQDQGLLRDWMNLAAARAAASRLVGGVIQGGIHGARDRVRASRFEDPA